ncbi:DUF1642 domain-containing protein [Metabacillus sp. 84]|uniref:DUF1642 domain-containing protein n=1 Tax=Metabacillus sp. 84 TaxID=3404705 RepID=UPI003CEECB11
MSEKVVLPKEVAEAIEKVWSMSDNATLSKHLYLNNWTQLYKDKRPVEDVVKLEEYAEEKPIEYMTALVNGYTVEQTPEERLLEWYQGYKSDKGLSAWAAGRRDGIITGIPVALNILGITIPGINDKEEAE